VPLAWLRGVRLSGDAGLRATAVPQQRRVAEAPNCETFRDRPPRPSAARASRCSERVSLRPRRCTETFQTQRAAV
jgi:hypothetical protein